MSQSDFLSGNLKDAMNKGVGLFFFVAPEMLKDTREIFAGVFFILRHY
jgi:hypothetical protein